MKDYNEKPLPKSNIRSINSFRKKLDFVFTPVPELLARDWLPFLNLSELRVILYISTRTWGFSKEWDAISIDQFCSGIVSRSGKRIDLGIAKSRSTVKRTIKSLETKGLIEVIHRRTKTNVFRLTIRPIDSYNPDLLASWRCAG